MNYFDDLRTRVEQSFNSAVVDFRSYIQDQVVTPTVKVGQAATGNLSEAQIKAGKKAAAPPIAVPDSLLATTGISIPMVLLIAALGLVVLHKKGRV